MSTKTYYFSGTAKWAKVREPDEKYQTYQIVLYMDKPSWALFKESGCQLKVHNDEDGDYVNFKAKSIDKDWNTGETREADPPQVFLKNELTGKYDKWPEGLIGNGSLCSIRVDVYDTRNGKGSRLISVGIDKLVEYTKQDKDTFDPSSQLKMPF